MHRETMFAPTVEEFFHLEDFFANPKRLSHVLPAGTGAGFSDYSAPLDSGPDRVFYVAYLALTTPQRVKSNIVVDSNRTTGLELLTEDQSPGTSYPYKSYEIWGAPLRVTSIRLKVETVQQLTKVQTTLLELGVRIAPKQY